MDSTLSKGEKLHAVCIPFPAQGHINPMLKLAKLLHSKSFHITFVNTQYNHKRLLKSRGSEALTGIPNFDFDAIPDGLPLSDSAVDATQDIPSLCHSTATTCLQPFLELLHKLNAKSLVTDVPPVTCIVADAGMAFSVRAAEEFGVPIALFWTISACGVWGFMQLPHLIQKGLVPPKDDPNDPTNNEDYYYSSETKVEWLPSKNIPFKVITSFFMAKTAQQKEIMLNYIIQMVGQSQKSSIIGIIFNTFHSLESQVLNFLSTKLIPTLFAIGPLQLLTNNELQFEEQQNHHSHNSLDLNLWKEDENCLKWLNSKHPKSVVYVNFGSITVLSKDQLVEFAWGLVNSGMPFLWIVRPDLVDRGGPGTVVLPPEFVSETRDRGMLASWCLQEEVLKHPAVGGFLTHNGWNSTLESISHGIPMICWPFFADQPMNCWYCCSELGIGMKINNDVKRDKVEELVRELMEGDKGKEMKKKAMKWKLEAEKAINVGGSSFQDMEKLICLLSKNHLPPTSSNNIK